MFEFNKVKLISYSTFVDKPECSLIEQVCYIARVSNPASQSNSLNNEKLCKYLLKHGHYSPFELVNVVLEIETTRDISRQIIRHRSFSFQEFSGRYADPVSELGFVTREARIQHPKNRQMSIDLPDDKKNLNLEFETLQKELIDKETEFYNFCVSNNIAKEQSRVILSEGLMKTKLYMQGSLRSWIHYINLRSEFEAVQREHWDVAIKCAKEISKVFPLIMSFVHSSDVDS